MRLVKRNLKPIWYSLYQGKTPVIDRDGYETGENRVKYGYVHELKCNISPASGQAVAELFGTLENYDNIIITDRMDCPINENSVLWIDNEPETEKEYRAVHSFVWNFGLMKTAKVPTGNVYATTPYEYVVKRVAKSLHHISYAISRVKVSV